MSINARQLGLDATVDELRSLLVSRFRIAKSPDSIGADEPLFEAGVGLSSLEGAELLAEVEKRFGIEFKNIERWFDDSPTLNGFAQYLVDHSRSETL